MTARVREMLEHQHRLTRGLIVAVACAIRLAFVLWYPQLPLVADDGVYDQEGYHVAFSRGVLLSNDGPFCISKGPIYPLFLAAIYRSVGYSHTAARVAQALASGAVVFLIMWLAERVFGRRTAIVAGILAAIYPPFISYSGLLLTETVSVFLLLAFVSCVARGLDAPGVGWWLGAGVLGGLLVLHRPETLLVLIATAAAMWAWRFGWRRIGVMVATVALVMLPWVLRNYAVYHRWVLVGPQIGSTLWLSANWHAWHGDDPTYRAVIDAAGPNAVEQDRRLFREAGRSLSQHPGRYLRICLQRIPQFWLGGHSNTFAHLEHSVGAYLAQGAYLTASIKLLMLALNLLVIVLGFAGMRVAWKLGLADSRHLILLMIPIAVTALVHLVLFATLRYQVPIMPFLILFAAFAVCHLRGVARDLVPA